MIQYFDIENFKCFPVRRVQLGKITILAGANSVGKSSVIQTLLLSRIAFERLKAVNYENIAKISVPLNGEFLLSLGNTIEVLNREAKENVIRFTYLDTNGRDRVQFEFKVEDVESSIYDLQILKIIPTSGNLPDTSLFQEQFHYLNAERIGPRQKYEVVSMPYLNVGVQGEHSIQVLNDKNFDIPVNRIYTPNQPFKLLAQARAWMEFIVPNVSIGDVQSYDKIRTAEIRYGDSSPTNVGFGVSYVLPIVLSGLIAAEGAMLIVENPEAHLHPSGQSRIGQFLAFIAAAGVQVVIETHSEHIINGIRIVTVKGNLKPDDALVNFFSHSEDGKIEVTPIHFTKKNDLEKWPVGFFDQSQIDFAQMFELKVKQRDD